MGQAALAFQAQTAKTASTGPKETLAQMEKRGRKDTKAQKVLQVLRA